MFDFFLQELTTQMYIRRYWQDVRLVHKGSAITVIIDFVAQNSNVSRYTMIKQQN